MEYIAIILSLVSLMLTVFLYYIVNKANNKLKQEMDTYKNFEVFLKQSKELYEDIRNIYSDILDDLEQKFEKNTHKNKQEDEIKSLLKKGYTVEQVAQILGKGKGEVKLIAEINNLI